MLHLEGHRWAITALAYTADGQTLVSASSGEVKLWDPLTGRETRTLPPLRGRGRVSFTPDGHAMAWGSWETSFSPPICIWLQSIDADRPERSYAADPNRGSGGRVAFSADGRKLAAATHTHIFVWDIQTEQAEVQRQTEDGIPHGLALAPDGRHLAASGPKYVNLYTLNSSHPHPQWLHWPAGNFRAVLFFPDGRTLAATRGRDIGLWDVATARRRLALQGHRETVRCLAVAPDGGALASGSDDWSVKLWNTATGRERASLNWRIGAITAVAFAPDGMTAAAGSERGRIFIWDVDTLDR